jgi:excisionase family DNA binding protein
METTDRKWLKLSEAANYLNVSRSTLLAWANRGIVTRHRLQGITRYDRAELDALLTNGAAGRAG